MRREKRETWEIEKEMENRGIWNPLDLQEFDADWVNPAIRRDIRRMFEKYNGKIFGLKCWDWKILRGEELLNAHNFDVDFIFREEDYNKVMKIIEYYEGDKNLKLERSRDTVNKLINLAIYTCWWV